VGALRAALLGPCSAFRPQMPHYANLTLGISMVFTIRKWETVIFEKTVYKMVWQKPF
jgi:hypothetical protein